MMVTHCKIVWILELIRLMTLNCGIHAFTIQSVELSDSETPLKI